MEFLGHSIKAKRRGVNKMAFILSDTPPEETQSMGRFVISDTPPPDTPPGESFINKIGRGLDTAANIGLKTSPLGFVTGQDNPITKLTGDVLSQIGVKAGNATVTGATNLGASPEVAGGLATVADLGTQILPATLIGVGTAKSSSSMLDREAMRLMQSSLKPRGVNLLSGDAQRAAKLFLERGWNATLGGLDKMQTAISDLENRIPTILENSGVTVPKQSIINMIDDVATRIQGKNFPQSGLGEVRRLINEYVNNWAIPQNIPATQAQQLKLDLYREIADTYGTVADASVRDANILVKKGMARGYATELGQQIPEIADVNKQLSPLLNALDVTEQKILMHANQNPLQFSVLAHNPKLMAIYLADRSPLFKSLVARMIYSGQNAIPASIGSLTTLGAENYNNMLTKDAGASLDPVNIMNGMLSKGQP